VCVCACVRACSWVCVCARECVCVCVCACTCACVQACMRGCAPAERHRFNEGAMHAWMLLSFFFLPCMVSSRWTLLRGLGTGEIVIKILSHLFKGSGKLMYKKLRSSSHINNWSVDGLSKLGQPSLDPLSRLVRCAPTPPGTRFKTPSTDRLRTVRPNWLLTTAKKPRTPNRC